MRAVAGESFALTLWTWAELSQLKRERQVDRMGERTDLAGLVAVAFHEPAKLQQAEMRYLSAAGRLSATTHSSAPARAAAPRVDTTPAGPPRSAHTTSVAFSPPDHAQTPAAVHADTSAAGHCEAGRETRRVWRRRKHSA